MKQIRFKSTNNGKFKYFEGKVTDPSNFEIGVVVWFNDFHTSAVQKIEYKYGKKDVDLKVTTLNSIYVFVIEESK